MLNANIDRRTGETTVSAMGSAPELAEDLVYLICVTNQMLKKQDPEDAKIFRGIISGGFGSHLFWDIEIPESAVAQTTKIDLRGLLSQMGDTDEEEEVD